MGDVALVKGWWTRERLGDLALFVIAFGLRALVISQYERLYPLADSPAIDEASYEAWALRIAGGDWLGSEVFFQEPLYPYSLGALYALLGPERVLARLAQAAVWGVSCVLVRRLAHKVFDARSGWIAGGLLAIYGPGLVFPALLLKENLFLPLLSGLVLLLIDARSPRQWLAVGVLAALGALLRGNMLILLPLLAIGAWWRARGQGLPLHSGLSRVLGLVAGVLLVLLPVAIRNSTVGGVFALSTSGAGTNLYGGNNLENPYGRASEFSFVRGIPEHEAEDWEHEAERRSGRELDRGEVSRFWAGEVAASVARDPLAHLSILWNKFRLTLHRYEVPDNHCIDWDRQYLPLTKAPWPDFGFVGLVSLAGLFCWLLRREWHSAAGVLCLCFALYLLTIVLTVTSDRSRLPLVPLLLPFGGWWLAQGLVDWRRRLVCAVPAALVVLLPALPADEEARDFAEREHNYAVTRLKQGRLAEARAITAPLLQAMPDSVRVQLLHAEIELRSGAQDPPALQAQLARLAADPRLRARERFHADVLAGQLALERRDSEAARVHLESARRFDPEDPVLIETWVIALAQGCELGRWGFDQLRLSASLLERVGPITRAGVEYLEGRTLRRENPGSAAGAAAIESALDRLQAPSLDKSLPAEERARARKLAGKIQLELGRKAQAANHFRAALSLLPGDAEALAGLAAAQAP